MANEIFYVRESALQSAISDTITFGIPALMAWGNYQFLGNSHVFQWAIVIIFFLSAVSKSSGKVKIFPTKKALMDYLEKEQPSNKSEVEK